MLDDIVLFINKNSPNTFKPCNRAINPFKMKIPVQIKLFYQQFKNYGDESGPYVRRFGLQYSNIFRWNRQRSFFDIGVRFELFDKSEAFTDQIEQRKFKIHLHQDNRDDPIYPKKGNVIVFQLNSYGGLLGGNRTYNKYDLDFRKYISPVSYTHLTLPTIYSV